MATNFTFLGNLTDFVVVEIWRAMTNMSSCELLLVVKKIQYKNNCLET
jgi:hypothetical protein